jgi:hypothetical protein
MYQSNPITILINKSIPMEVFRLSSQSSIIQTNTNLNLNQYSTSTSIVSTNTHQLINIPPCLLVLTTAAESALINSTILSSPSLTWQKLADAHAASSGDAEVFYAVHSGGDVSVTNIWNRANTVCSSVLYVFTGASIPTNFVVATTQSQPSVTINTTKTNSVLIAVSSDWNAASGTITYRNTPVIQTLTHSVIPKYQSAHWYKQTTNITSYIMGETSPSGQAAGTIVVEISR